jgi:hypothetical protein
MIATTQQQDGFDGQSIWSGGMDGGRRGDLLNQDQYQEGENVVCRGGTIGTRPVWRARTLNYLNSLVYNQNGTRNTSGVDSVPPQSEIAFESGLFQGALYYDPPNDVASIVAMIGGRMFRLVPRRGTMDMTEIPMDKQNRANIPISYLVQADKFLLVQDGESSCIIYDGVNARRAGKNEIPVGTIMAYGQGRVVLIGNNRKDILFGDLYGSHPGEPGDSVIQFTETTFLSEGGAASIPFSMGHIRGAIFYPIQDTTMGQGELLVAAEKGWASFFLSLPRDQWKTSAFQRQALLEIGGESHRALTAINNDVWFRSRDGWRIYRQARAEAKGWFQLPLSTEVGKFTDNDTQSLLQYASSIRFNNRLIVTSTPIPNQGRPYHNGLLSLDFDVLSSFGQAKMPSWDGHWSGIKVTQLVEGNFGGIHRAFAFGLEGGANVVYELVENQVEDSVGPVASYVIPHRFNFQQPFNESEACDLDLWIEGAKRNSAIHVFFKPDGYPRWLQWNSAVNIHDVNPIQNVDAISGIPTVADGFKPRLGISTPLVAADTLSTNRDLKRSYEVDIKVMWTGNMKLHQMRVRDRTQIEKSTSNRQ